MKSYMDVFDMESSDESDDIPMLPIEPVRQQSKPRKPAPPICRVVKKRIVPKRQKEIHVEPIPEPKEVVIVAPPPPKEWKTFSITRDVKYSIRGASYFYSLSNDETTFFVAKAKSRHPTKPVAIGQNSDIHLGAKNEYVLCCDPTLNQFTLRPNGLYGVELFTIKFTGSEISARIFEGNMFTPRDLQMDNNFPDERKNYYQLFCAGEEFFSIRKTHDSCWQMNVLADTPPIIIFAIALAISIAKND